ncbi:gp90 [Bacillus phage G]|uniref:Gp90 n=1 Tax=Bacillus phage G TaxID=2884420 RepID=G3MBF8_9CAUD|nr:gp90 [Bacillus phage G]AEO93358.1 gp90 [Bacillus phage G]
MHKIDWLSVKLLCLGGIVTIALTELAIIIAHTIIWSGMDV